MPMPRVVNSSRLWPGVNCEERSDEAIQRPVLSCSVHDTPATLVQQIVEFARIGLDEINSDSYPNCLHSTNSDYTKVTKYCGT